MPYFTAVYTESDFARTNPWFYIAIENRSEQIARDVLRKDFSKLFRQEMADEATFTSLKRRLTAETDRGLTVLQEETERGRRRLEAETRKVVERVADEKGVQSELRVAVLSRYNRLESDLQMQFDTSQKARDDRLNRVEWGQALTFLGGLAAGAGALYLGQRYSR